MIWNQKNISFLEEELLKQEKNFNKTHLARHLCFEYPELFSLNDIESIRRKIRSVCEKKYKNDNKLEDEVEDGKLVKSITDSNKGINEITRIFTRDPSNFTDEKLIKTYKINTKKWKIVKKTISSWDTTSTKAGVTATNYSCKILLEEKEIAFDYEDLLKQFQKDIVSPKKVEKIEYVNNKTGNMLEINIADLHLGKLAWKDETGENYDYKIARKRFKTALVELVQRNLSAGIDKILYVTGNDFFHFDNINVTTTKGTQQDSDMRWQKMFSIGSKLQVLAIDYLKTVAPVEIKYIFSNHDFQTGYYLAMYIDAWYKNDSNVTCDISPSTRKYVKWGDCLIGYSHGDKERKRIDGIMQVESKDWSATKFRFWQLAHLHSEHSYEVNGIIIRNVSSVCGTDSWHSACGYVGATKKAQSFLYNKEKGLVSITNAVIV